MRSLIRQSRTDSSARDEGSGLILVFLVMLIASAMSLVLLENAVSMAGQTTANNKRVTSISAAQAGLDAGLGQIRAATNALTGAGDVSAIPCTINSGAVGASSFGNYSVNVAYFSVDPSAQNQGWRSTSSNQINCPVGGHPDKVPSYALLTSTGTATGGAKARTVQTTYIFTTTNQNISGGQIHAYDDGTGHPDLCVDAGSAQPSAGSTVTLEPCTTTASTVAAQQAQSWAYQSDLSVLLVSTTNNVAPKTPLCLSAQAAPAVTVGTQLLLSACAGDPTTGTVSLYQQFSFDDSAHLRNSVLNGSGAPTLGSYCWTNPTIYQPGAALIMSNNCNGYASNNTWRPDAAVGAGMSGAATQQLVNYQEFGRCIDATDQDPNHSYMIAFPCKQSPSPSEITWNQKYSYNSSTGTISTYDTANSITYCLTSPMAVETDPTVAGPFVRLNPCPTSALPTSMKWVEIGNTGDYDTSYVIHDSSNPALCLGLGLTGGSTGSSEAQWDSVYVQTCNGSLVQKWNAPPNVPIGSVTDTNETNDGS